MRENESPRCWRSECRNECYYPDVCDERDAAPTPRHPERFADAPTGAAVRRRGDEPLNSAHFPAEYKARMLMAYPVIAGLTADEAWVADYDTREHAFGRILRARNLRRTHELFLKRYGAPRCLHGEREGDCSSCAACAACDGSCGICPYATPAADRAAGGGQ